MEPARPTEHADVLGDRRPRIEDGGSRDRDRHAGVREGADVLGFDAAVAPACEKASRYRSGSAIIRCTSSTAPARSASGLSAATTSGPMLRLGTKCPSMTST